MKASSGRLLFILSYFAYSCIYIARLNLTVASPVMQNEQILSAAQIGTMGGVFFLFYSAGQLLNGYLGDIFPPKLMVLTGLFLTAATNLSIGFMPDADIIILLWGINGFGQSMLWGPLLRTIAAHFSEKRKSSIAAFLVSSVGAGSILGVFAATAAIYYRDVRYAFYWPGSIALLAFFIILVCFRPKVSCRKLPDRKLLNSMFTPGLLLVLVSAMFHGVLKDNINLWMASYFMDTFSVDLLTMSFYVFAIPVLSMAGRLLYPPLYRMLGCREHTVSIAALSVAALSLTPLCFDSIPLPAAVLGLSVAAAAISMVNTSFLTIYPIRYQSVGCVSKAVGLIDFATYLGAGLSSVLYGIWLESHSYSGMFLSWILLAILAVLLLLIVCKKEKVQYE